MLDDSKLELTRYYPIDSDNGYEKDQMSVVTCAPVRRLQQKTQVFPLDIKASVRSRLTHSMEVQCLTRQIILKIAQKNDFYRNHLLDLLTICESSALVHDIGNPPFGHFGERVIGSFLKEQLPTIFRQAIPNEEPSEQWRNILFKDLISFDGNAQSLRILHSIQKLNLSSQILASLIKVPCNVEETKEKRIGYFYSEKSLINFIRDSLELEIGERFELVNILEYADDVCFALADIEDAMDRNLINIYDIERMLTDYCEENVEELVEDIIRQSSNEGISFIQCIRENYLNSAIDNFVELFTESLESPIESKNVWANCNDDENLLIKALKKFAVREVFRKLEIETLELTGSASLYGMMKFYQKVLCLNYENFNSILNGNEIDDPLLRRLVHRISRRQIDAYRESLESKELYFERKEEKELYYRIRLIIDYISGMTDTYIQYEFSLLKGICL